MGADAAKAQLNFPVISVFGTLQHPVSNKLHGGWFTVARTRSHGSRFFRSLLHDSKATNDLSLGAETADVVVL